jgi:hypothetical protein
MARGRYVMESTAYIKASLANVLPSRAANAL